MSHNYQGYVQIQILNLIKYLQDKSRFNKIRIQKWTKLQIKLTKNVEKSQVDISPTALIN